MPDPKKRSPTGRNSSSRNRGGDKSVAPPAPDEGDINGGMAVEPHMETSNVEVEPVEEAVEEVAVTPPPPPIPDAMREEPILEALITELYEGGRDDFGFYHGEGEARYSGGHSYQGQFFHGKMHGVGTYQWSNGTAFCGEFHYNQIQGKGAYSWPNGSIYEGDVESGLRHGIGIYTSSDQNTSYNGQWLKGKRCGKGIMMYNSSGDSYYEGEWHNNNKCGYGIRRYASGNIYEGDWLDNVRHGQGTMYWYDQGQEYTGAWENGVQHGQGEIIWYLQRVANSQYPLRNQYIGKLLRGERNGQGAFYYANGSVYEGEWSSNKKHGEGKFTFKNGSVYRGRFSDDHMVDFPDLILSGMTTPDIASAGLPIKSVTSLRVASSLGGGGGAGFVLENANDTMLDINVDDLYHERRLNVEEQEQETENLTRVILASITPLKKMYKFYSGLGVGASVDNTFVMTQLQLWRMLKDHKVHLHGCSLVEMDRVMVQEQPGEEIHEGRRQIFMRDFLNNLIRIGTLIYGQASSVDTNKTIISSSLQQLLDEMPKQVEPQGAVFKYELARAQEALQYYDEVVNVYHYFSSVSSKLPGDMCMTMRDVLLLMRDLSLTNDRLTAAAMTRILTAEHGGADDHNFDIEVTPLEFFEFIVDVSRVFVADDEVKLEERIVETSFDNSSGDLQDALSGIDTENFNGDLLLDPSTSMAGDSEKPLTTSARTSEPADENKPANKPSKRAATQAKDLKKPEVNASKSKEKKEEKKTVEKSHSKDKVHTEGDDKKTKEVKGKSPSDRKAKKHEKSSENDLHASDVTLKKLLSTEAISPKGSAEDEIDAVGDGEGAVVIGLEREVSCSPSNNPTEPTDALLNTPIPPLAITPAEPVEDFQAWSAKLKRFIRGNLHAAYTHRCELDRGIAERKEGIAERKEGRPGTEVAMIADELTNKLLELVI